MHYERLFSKEVYEDFADYADGYQGEAGSNIAAVWWWEKLQGQKRQLKNGLICQKSSEWYLHNFRTMYEEAM